MTGEWVSSGGPSRSLQEGTSPMVWDVTGPIEVSGGGSILGAPVERVGWGFGVTGGRGRVSAWLGQS